MPFNGAGAYSPPAADFPAVANTLIESAKFNDIINDIATALSLCITKDGQQAGVSANIPFGGFALTGIGSGLAARTRAANIGDVQDGTTQWVAAGGTADALTATYVPAITALIDGQICCIRAASANATSTPTFAPNGLTAHTITKLGGNSILPGDWVTAQELVLRYNLANTRWEALGALRGDLVKYPLNVNPNWLLDQINEGTAYAGTAAAVSGPDGWTLSNIGGSAGRASMQVVTDPANAALKALKISCTTQQALAAGDAFTVFTMLEGYDVADLKSGTASASQITVMFKAQFPAAGTYSLYLQNSAQNRSNIQSITVPDANENSYAVTFQLDITGTWLYTNGVGLHLGICLGAGATFQGVAGWQAGNVRAVAAQTNFIALNTNVAYIKRIHVIQGSVALPYAPQDAQRDLAKAQRYYAKTFNQGVAPANGVGGFGGALTGKGVETDEPQTNWSLPVEMRASPTITLFNPRAGGAAGQWTDNSGTETANARALAAGTRTVLLDNSGIALALGNLLCIMATANARLS